MSGRQHTSAERQRNHRDGQRRIRRRCACGRIFTGNAAWWSHLNGRDAQEHPNEHGPGGRA